MLLSYVFLQNRTIRRIINQPPRSQTQNKFRSLSHEPLNRKAAAWYLKTSKKPDTFRGENLIFLTKITVASTLFLSGWAVWSRTTFCWFQIGSCVLVYKVYTVTELLILCQKTVFPGQMGHPVHPPTCSCAQRRLLPCPASCSTFSVRTWICLSPPRPEWGIRKKIMFEIRWFYDLSKAQTDLKSAVHIIQNQSC